MRRELSLVAALGVAASVACSGSGGDSASDAGERGVGGDDATAAAPDGAGREASAPRDAEGGEAGQGAEAEAEAPDGARSADAGDAGDSGGDGDAGEARDADAAPPLGLDCAEDAGADGDAPTKLGCTGLYAVWPSRTIAPDVEAYDPGLHLWSDGAEKSRYIRLPRGARIDTSNMDEWTFPTGTKLWKEFRLGGRPVETRLLWKRGPGTWVKATYAWSDDASDAVRLDGGRTNVWGTSYEIPPRDACTTCHAGRIDEVLGFEAVSLASPAASGLTLPALVSRGLVTDPPRSPIVVPGAGTPAQAALGWLHANCGTACHNRSPRAFANATGLWMRLEVGSLAKVESTDTYQTAVGVVSGFQTSPDSGLLRIAPHDVAHSAIPFRDGTRDDQGQMYQMPPIDTHVPDTTGVSLVDAWIESLP